MVSLMKFRSIFFRAAFACCLLNSANRTLHIPMKLALLHRLVNNFCPFKKLIQIVIVIIIYATKCFRGQRLNFTRKFTVFSLFSFVIRLPNRLTSRLQAARQVTLDQPTSSGARSRVRRSLTRRRPTRAARNRRARRLPSRTLCLM